MTRQAKALRKLLLSLGMIDPSETIVIRRTYAGHHQRSASAWSWELEDENGYEFSIGSKFPVREILAAKKVSWRNDEFGQIHLYVEAEE